MKSSTMSQPTTQNKPQQYKEPLNARIKAKAYELWEKRGRRNGTAQADWLEAERIIKNQTV